MSLSFFRSSAIPMAWSLDPEMQKREPLADPYGNSHFAVLRQCDFEARMRQEH